MPLTDNLVIAQTQSGVPAITAEDFIADLGDDFVTIATDQTITAKKTFIDNIVMANNIPLEGIDTVGTSQNFIEITATNIINIGSVANVMQLFSVGDLNIISLSSFDNIVEIQAATARSSLLRMAGNDIAQPITDLQPADVYLDIKPISGVNGGAQLTGINDADASAQIIRSYIGVTNPTDTIPALEFLTGKSDGGTNIAGLGTDETAYQFSNFDGTLEYITIGGAGNIGINKNFNVNVILDIQALGSDFAMRALNNIADVMFQADAGDLTVATGANAADTMFIVNDDATSSRSINASGTINASGADYAEYEKKSPTCGIIEKGDICGFDINGELTDKFNEAISFCIKSTKPSYVGGDAWAVEGEQIREKPVKPVLIKPDFPDIEKPTIGKEPESPGEFVIPNRIHRENKRAYKLRVADLLEEHGAVLADYNNDHRLWVDDKEIYDAALIIYQNTIRVHDIAISALQNILDTVDIPAYKIDRENWKNEFEVLRQQVDRIAYAGKIPCKVVGNVGDTVIPIVGPNDNIEGKSILNPSFAEYLISIGKIHSLTNDLPIVIVKIG